MLILNERASFSVSADFIVKLSWKDISCESFMTSFSDWRHGKVLHWEYVPPNFTERLTIWKASVCLQCNSNCNIFWKLTDWPAFSPTEVRYQVSINCIKQVPEEGKNKFANHWNSNCKGNWCKYFTLILEKKKTAELQYTQNDLKLKLDLQVLTVKLYTKSQYYDLLKQKSWGLICDKWQMTC